MDQPSATLDLSALNLAVAMAGSAEQSGQRFRRWDDVWASDREMSDAEANFVVLTRPLLPDAVGDLTGRLVEFFQESGSPWILWSAWPVPDLTPFGYELGGYPPVMVRKPGDDNSSKSQDLRIEMVTDRAGLELFERVFIDGYGLAVDQPYQPGKLFREGALAGPLQFWIGFRGDNAVSVAAGCTAHGVRGIYAVATLPEERGHGYGAAVTGAAMQGTNLPVVLQSSELGYPVYRRLGFQELGKYALWVGPRPRGPSVTP